ncbi:MAG: hypothetical protein ACJ76Z_13435 [Thermoleophilaceae bacterium]
MRAAGGNHKTIQKCAERWQISTAHFDMAAVRARSAHRIKALPLEQVLVENSTYHRGALKRRLYAAGLKRRECELCGQGENWRGHRMSLILDHANGIATDNRLQNLRIVCPNCAATLDTHCGRNIPRVRACPSCGATFEPESHRHRFCSLPCWGAAPEHPGKHLGPQPDKRKVERPSYEQLLREIAETSWSAVGRKYGVSDNAVRKWVRAYERDAVPALHEAVVVGDLPLGIRG